MSKILTEILKNKTKKTENKTYCKFSFDKESSKERKGKKKTQQSKGENKFH